MQARQKVREEQPDEGSDGCDLVVGRGDEIGGLRGASKIPEAEVAGFR